MVENRKLLYAISLMLLTCCQIITMLPHNVASSESSSSTQQSSNSTAHNSNYNVKEEYLNNSSNGTRKNTTSNSNNNNHSNTADDDKNDSLIIAVASQRNTDEHTIVSGEETWQGQENDSRPMDNIDDLIFLDKRTINQQQQQQEQQQHHHHHSEQERQQYNQHQQLLDHHHPQHTLHNEHKHYEFHHITMDGGNSNSNSNSDEDTDSLTDTTYSTMIVVDADADDDDDGEQETESEHDDGIPHEIELQPDINEEVTPLNVTPLDLSDFISLIPATKVKGIVNHYYHNDPEVQRAHAFMSSRDFLMLKQHIIAIPEMSAFLRYLNNSGLDLVKFVTALTNLTAYNSDKVDAIQKATAIASATTELDGEQPTTIDKTMGQTNDIEYVEQQGLNIQPTLTNIEIETMNATVTTTTNAPATTMNDMNETTTIAKEQLNGLHGLVDNVLDVLPQDQILATFFDKLEANEQFSKLVDNIGSPEFARILNNMQNSIPLRNLIFTLHNNGIYVIRIVDSLKSYFFLGGF